MNTFKFSFSKRKRSVFWPPIEVWKLVLSKTKDSNKTVFYLADYPSYSTKEWSTTIQKTLKSRRIYTAPIIFLKMIGLFGDIVKVLFRFDPPLTSSRLFNMRVGGEYPIKNTKKIVGDLPYNLSE